MIRGKSSPEINKGNDSMRNASPTVDANEVESSFDIEYDKMRDNHFKNVSSAKLNKYMDKTSNAFINNVIYHMINDTITIIDSLLNLSCFLQS